MRLNSYKLFVLLVLMMVVSCNEPETVVTNYVHPDGSVTRIIEMRSINEKADERFAVSDLQVPFDSTWSITDSREKLDEKGDSLWVRKAVKLFKNVDEINLTYKSDSGANKEISRHAGFTKRFRWFNTVFRFSETIDKKLSFGYPVRNFLNREEQLYFYSPDYVRDNNLRSIDSLKFKALGDSVKSKTDKWTMKCLVSEWIGEFSKLTANKAESDNTIKSLKAQEDEIVKIAEKNDKKLDSLWKNGILLKEFIGEEKAVQYKVEADSALSSVTNNLMANFHDYSVRIEMPGKLIGTNGFIDSSHVLLWPVKSDFFMAEPYDMWAESRIPNRWAWVVSVLFLVFVSTGLIIRVVNKRG